MCGALLNEISSDFNILNKKNISGFFASLGVVESESGATAMLARSMSAICEVLRIALIGADRGLRYKTRRWLKKRIDRLLLQ
jgi:hypothetical protein